MKVVIMAGGKGTRISSVANDIPKPMIRVSEKPVLQHQIENLKKQGFDDFIIVTGHLRQHIHQYFGTGESFGVRINYYDEETPLGTAGALYYLKEVLTEDFIMLNGDIMFDVDFSRMIRFHNSHSGSATILTHPNSHPYDSGLIVTDKEGKVLQWINKEEERDIYKNRVNAGIHILSPDVLELINTPGKWDLDRQIFKSLIKSDLLYAYDSPEYIKDMGTPDRYKQVCMDYEMGMVSEKNLNKRQKAIFLDRDGTINVYKGFITSPDQVELIEGVAKAISIMNKKGWLVIVVSNQPVIARGDCSIEELEQIFAKMETALGLEGAYVDDIYYCPHHPDKGFEGERIEYKVICNCRKPEPGLLYRAAEDYNIDLEASYMVGDSERDIQAGQRCKTKTVLLSEKNSGIADMCFSSLLEFVESEIGDR